VGLKICFGGKIRIGKCEGTEKRDPKIGFFWGGGNEIRHPF